MTTSPQPEPPYAPLPAPKKTRRRWLWGCLLVPVLLVLAGAAPFAWYWWRHQGARLIGHHKGGVAKLWFSADGKTLYTFGSPDVEEKIPGVLKVWDVESATERKQFQVDGPVAFSADRKTLALVGKPWNVVQLWSTTPLQKRSELKVAPMVALNLALSPDGTRMAVAGREYHVKEEEDVIIEHLQLWDLPNQRLLKRLEGLEDFTFALEFSPNGQWLVGCSRDRTARVWDTATGKEVVALTTKAEDNFGHLRTAAFSPDGKYLALHGGGTIPIWEVPSWKQVITLRSSSTEPPGDLAFSPDGRWLAATGVYLHFPYSKGGLIEFWEVDGWRRRGDLLRHSYAPHLTFSPDSTQLATGEFVDHKILLSRVP